MPYSVLESHLFRGYQLNYHHHHWLQGLFLLQSSAAKSLDSLLWKHIQINDNHKKYRKRNRQDFSKYKTFNLQTHNTVVPLKAMLKISLTGSFYISYTTLSQVYYIWKYLFQIQLYYTGIRKSIFDQNFKSIFQMRFLGVSKFFLEAYRRDVFRKELTPTEYLNLKPGLWLLLSTLVRSYTQTCFSKFQFM